MAKPPEFPDFLKGNIPLQRRYLAALRSQHAGCNSGCAKAATIRKFQKLALQQNVAVRPRRS